MKKNLTKILALLLVSSVAFTACKKNKEDSLAITKENLAGTYMLTSIKINGEEKIDDELEACKKDDEYILQTDMIFQYNDAGAECSSNGDYESTWDLDDKYIEVGQYSGEVKTLTSKTLVFGYSYSAGGVTASYLVTFSKK